MKKFILTLLLIVPLVTGCTSTSINTKLSLNKNNSASVETVLNYDGNLANKYDKQAALINKYYKRYADSKYKVEKNYAEKKSTITALKSVKDIRKEDLNLESLGFSTNLPNGKFVEVKKNFWVTSYNIDMIYSLPRQIKEIKKADVVQKENSMRPEYLKYADRNEIVSDNDDVGRADFAANFDRDVLKDINDDASGTANKKDGKLAATFSIELPSFASSNNADNVNLNTYTWNIRKGSETKIVLQYVVYSGFAIFILFLAGVAFLVYLARRILRHDSNKRIGSKN